MTKNMRAWVYIFPVLHLLFIGTMITWHIQGIDFFGHVSDRLSLRGSLQVSPSGTPGISQLDVQYEGLNFPFFNRSTVRAVDPSQETRRLQVTGYNTLEDGFSVLFNEGFSLQFITQNPNELRIISTIPESMQPISEIILPIRLIDNATVQQTDNIAVLSVNVGSDVYLLTLPPRAVLNAERGTLTIPGSVGRQTIRYLRTERMVEVLTEETDVRPWYERETTRVSTQAYNTAVQSFIDVSYSGWKNTRYDAGTSTWRRPGGSPDFREITLLAYLAESWKRNEYTAAFNAMRTAADRHPEAITYLSSVYLGNLNQRRQQQEAARAERNATLLAAFSDGDTTPIRDGNLIDWVIMQGTPELYDALPAYIAEIQISSLSVQALAGMLENSLNSNPMPAAVRSSLENQRNSIVEIFLENLIRTEDSVFLESASGQVDLMTSLRVGRAFSRLGAIDSDEQLIGIGRKMVLSALNEADSLGFLPELLLISNSQVIERQGQIPPENAYEHIHTNAAYPKMKSLYEELGQGSYIYTVGGVESVQASQSELRIQLSAPRLRTHYLYIHGLPQYRALSLFGFQWPGDISFENYSRGTFYHAASETAMIKYFDDEVSGEIIYQF